MTEQAAASSPQFFDINDKTALVCCDNIEYQNQIMDVLTRMDYKIHVGYYLEDIAMKIRSHTYNVIIVYENFMGMTLADNSVLHELQAQPMGQRRFQYIVLAGESFSTADRLSSFIFSTCLTVHPADLSQLEVLLRKGVTEHEDFYHTFKSVQKERG